MFLIRKLAAATLVAASLTTPAFAQSVDEQVSVRVSYADLDITHSPGAQILLRRLNAAAVQACGGEPDARVLAERAAFEKCRTAAVTQAIVRLNSPVLTAMARTASPILVARR